MTVSRASHSAHREGWRDRYERAAALLRAGASVRNAAVFPRWSPDSRHFWYERLTADHDREYRLIEAASGRIIRSIALSQVAARFKTINVPPGSMPPRCLRLTLEAAYFDVGSREWRLGWGDDLVVEIGPAVPGDWSISPDGTKAIRHGESNLWLRDLRSGETRALTRDGTTDYSYGEPPQAYRSFHRRRGSKPEGLWSPDSRLYLTVQTDDRLVADLPLVDFAPGGGERPTVELRKIAHPGDEHIAEFRVLVIDTLSGRQTQARYPTLPAVRMSETPFAYRMAWWSADAATAYFVHVERGERQANFVAMDAHSGECRILFSETSETSIELGPDVYGPILAKVLPDSGELIWYSERSGHGHLYLYDLVTGACRNAITSGAWQVRQILHVDVERRQLAISASGLEPTDDPYLRRTCLAGMDGSLTLTSDAVGDQIVWSADEHELRIAAMTVGDDVEGVNGFAPNGEFFVETEGAISRLPRTSLRHRSGEMVAVVEEACGTALPAFWRWPEPFAVKAADGTTDLYGLLYTPARLEAGRRYPVIDIVYGGPQLSLTPKAAFAELFPTVVLLDLAAFAELDAFTLVVDGRGTANRGAAFRTASYGAMETTSNLEDHIAAIRQLSASYPQMDLDRVGAAGMSAGGYLAALAACRRGDFYKVAVASSGNHDQSVFWHCWGERYQGPHESETYRNQAVRAYATQLTAKLLLMHGMLDWGPHPAGFFQLIQALVEADKDFDMLALPRLGHEIDAYAVRKRFDYFVANLVGADPPKGVSFPPRGPRRPAISRHAWPTEDTAP